MPNEPNIKRTLKKRLFDKPCPIDPNVYREISPSLFPGRRDFLKFLDEPNYELCVKLAKRILLRLSYESHISPPMQIQRNLLDVETRKGARRGEGYIPRDHFVHQVHLYLLGIYIFFYHRGINKGVKAHFRRMRRLDSGFRELKANAVKFTPVEDFVQAWRMFVVWHDIGYPWELFSCEKTSRSGNDERNSALKPFHNIAKGIQKELALKAISRLVALKNIWADRKETLSEIELDEASGLWRKETNGFRQLNEEEVAEVHDDWGDALRLPRLAGEYAARCVASIIDDDSAVAVLRRKTDNVAVALVPGKRGSDAIFLEKSPRASVLLKKNLWSLAIEQRNAPTPAYYWVYYAVKADETLDGFLQEILGSQLKDFKNTAKFLSDRSSLDHAMIATDEGYRAYCFHLYLVLCNLLSYLPKDRSILGLDHFFEAAASVLRSFEENVGDRIVEAVRNDFVITLKNMKMKEYKGKSVKGIIRKIVKATYPSIEEMTGKLEERVGKKIGNEINARTELYSLTTAVREKFESEVCRGVSFKPPKDFDIDWAVLYTVDGWDSIDERFTVSGPCSWENILKYRPEHIQKKGKECEKYYDHGVVSATALIESREMIRKISKTLIENEGGAAPVNIKLLRIAVGVASRIDDIDLKYEADQICEESIYAVGIHNLYPMDFKGEEKRQFRTKFRDEPFAFLSLLADSLQPWDRKRGMNPALSVLPYSTYSSGFNIDIRGDVLQITEFGEGLNIQERKKTLRSYLGGYLQGVERLIELSLSEWGK